MSTRPGWIRSGVLGALLAATLPAVPVQAHPHVWITVQTTVAYKNGAFTGLEHVWTFDEFYTAMAIEGLDKNNDGKYDREELAELTKVNMDGLKEYQYFTVASLAGAPLKMDEARDAWLEHKDGLLALHFTLPFAQPVLTDAKGLSFSVQDSTFFIAFTLAKTDPVKLGPGTPAGCKAVVTEPGGDKGAASGASGPASPADQQAAGFTMLGGQSVAVSCSGP